MSDEKKQSFLHGAALLAGATAIVKVIGAFYKIPLNAIIGEQGFSYFYTAYEIYSVLLLISTAGLPVAVSRLISQAHSLRHYNQVRQVYKTSRNIFLVLGALSSLLMTVFCKPLAEFMEQPDAWFAIGCLGPCALLVCLLSAYRGFFQGQGNMIPTSVSEVVEAFFKLVIGVAAAVALLRMTKNVSYAAGGAILGVTISCLISGLYLSSKFRKTYKDLPKSAEKPRSTRSTAKSLLSIAIPITIGSAGLQLMSVVEAKLYMGQLLSLGNTQAQADTMKGIYNMTQTIFNMPCSFIPAITMSIIPAITSHITLMNDKAVCATEESAARITGLIALPCAVGLFVLAEPVTALIGGYEGEKLVLAGQLMALMGNGDHRYPKLSEEHLAKIITLNGENLEQIENGLNGKILFTPGHTADSISLVVDGNLFCGDAAMDGIPSSRKITIWIENKMEFEKSWDAILASGAKKIFPAHGSPFSPCELRKNKKFIAGLHLRPLKHK